MQAALYSDFVSVGSVSDVWFGIDLPVAYVPSSWEVDDLLRWARVVVLETFFGEEAFWLRDVSSRDY